jgi:lysine/ornithine N-monooxygenase
MIGLASPIFIHNQKTTDGGLGFNNISVISWRSVLLVEETGENHKPAASH